MLHDCKRDQCFTENCMVLFPVSRVSSHLSIHWLAFAVPCLFTTYAFPLVQLSILAPLRFYCLTSSLQTQFSVALSHFSRFPEYWEFVVKIRNYEVCGVSASVFLHMWLIWFDIQLNIYFTLFLFEWHLQSAFFSKLNLKLIFSPKLLYLYHSDTSDKFYDAKILLAFSYQSRVNMKWK